MSRIKLKQVDQIWRKTVSDAQRSFIRHCQLKNLAPYTVKYYKENLQFFLDSMPQVKFVDEINQELIDHFMCMLMDKGNRVTAINARLRAAFAFLRYCFEQQYAEAFPLSLIKEDETFKEPYHVFDNANDFNVSSLFENIQINGWSHTDHTGLSGADLTEGINQMASGGIGGFGPKYFSISALLRPKAFFVKSHSRVGRFRTTFRRRSTRFCQYW